MSPVTGVYDEFLDMLLVTPRWQRRSQRYGSKRPGTARQEPFGNARNAIRKRALTGSESEVCQSTASVERAKRRWRLRHFGSHQATRQVGIASNARRQPSRPTQKRVSVVSIFADISHIVTSESAKRSRITLATSNLTRSYCISYSFLSFLKRSDMYLF